MTPSGVGLLPGSQSRHCPRVLTRPLSLASLASSPIGGAKGGCAAEFHLQMFGRRNAPTLFPRRGNNRADSRPYSAAKFLPGYSKQKSRSEATLRNGESFDEWGLG